DPRRCHRAAHPHRTEPGHRPSRHPDRLRPTPPPRHHYRTHRRRHLAADGTPVHHFKGRHRRLDFARPYLYELLTTASLATRPPRPLPPCRRACCVSSTTTPPPASPPDW